MDFSSSREIIGVRDIGLKSEQEAGEEILGSGVMTARFHWDGTVAELVERLKM